MFGQYLLWFQLNISAIDRKGISVMIFNQKARYSFISPTLDNSNSSKCYFVPDDLDP